MPDFNKGDFTQQGVAGHVNANLRLNEKRLVNIDLTSNEDDEGCTIAGNVTDLLNNEVYPIGAGVSGNIEITENGENINVAPYATATVNVSGGGLEYETNTIVYGTNQTELTAQFSETHDKMPYIVTVVDVSGTYSSETYAPMCLVYFCYWDLLHATVLPAEGDNEYGMVFSRHRGTGGNQLVTGGIQLTHTSDDAGSSDYTYPKYWVTNTGITMHGITSSFSFKAGRTYRWTAIWAPNLL